jgi:hypothetical protein
MGVGCFVALVGIWQQFVGQEYLVSLGYEYNVEVRTSQGLLRSFSTFNQPFPFAFYVMISLLIGGSVALADPLRKRNALFLLLTPVMLAGMATSIVRASYLGLICGLLWLATFRYRRVFLLIVPAVLGVVVAVIVIPPRAIAAALSSSSFGERSTGWARIASDVLSHPLGLGLGTSGSAAEKLALEAGRSPSSTYQPDNYYVKMALELGPLGLWLFVSIILSAVLSTLWASRVLRGADAALALGVSASVVAMIVASTVATYLEIFPLDVYFWLLLGVVGCAVSQHKSTTTRSPFAQAEAAYRPT